MDNIDMLSFRLELGDLLDKFNTQLIIMDDQLLVENGNNYELIAIEICNRKELLK